MPQPPRGSAAPPWPEPPAAHPDVERSLAVIRRFIDGLPVPSAEELGSAGALLGGVPDFISRRRRELHSKNAPLGAEMDRLLGLPSAQPAAAPPAAPRSAAPEWLWVSAPDQPSVEGAYRRRAEAVRGRAVWAQGDCRIYSDAYGAWAVTDVGDVAVQRSQACIVAGSGGGTLPDGAPHPCHVPRWMSLGADGQWRDDLSVSITPWQPPAELPRSPGSPAPPLPRSLASSDDELVRLLREAGESLGVAPQLLCNGRGVPSP
eukprot:TRINITY_DN11196_c0_g1_i1.p2 TRINITY_DN11196_c0_g1~~TRINITY_DN11196_c0_g1_i1.p2  ORF type:complete len:290 (+),score=66.39 TRINITY_DN11196_c0_g1_i1:88-870(+)